MIGDVPATARNVPNTVGVTLVASDGLEVALALDFSLGRRAIDDILVNTQRLNESVRKDVDAHCTCCSFLVGGPDRAEVVYLRQ